MTPWACRAHDEASLFNPAFCGLLLHEAIKGYCSVYETGMPFPTSFLVLLLVLPKGTREKLPKRLAAGNGLASWTVAEPEAKIDFARRMTVLNPVTRESLLFLFRAGAITVVGQSNLVTLRKKRQDAAPLQGNSEEIAECFKAASFVGRWLANAGPPQSSYALLGVRP